VSGDGIMREDASTLYGRHTDANGASYVEEHRVWDRAGFVAKAHARAASLNEDARKKPGASARAKFEQITEQQYKQERVK
jgi:hypothetical protein